MNNRKLQLQQNSECEYWKMLHTKGLAMSLLSNQPLDHQKSYYSCICLNHFVHCKHFDCIMHIFVPHQQSNYNTVGQKLEG